MLGPAKLSTCRAARQVGQGGGSPAARTRAGSPLSAGPRPGAAQLWARRWGSGEGKRAAGPSRGARSCPGLARSGPPLRAGVDPSGRPGRVCPSPVLARRGTHAWAHLRTHCVNTRAESAPPRPAPPHPALPHLARLARPAPASVEGGSGVEGKGREQGRKG